MVFESSETEGGAAPTRDSPGPAANRGKVENSSPLELMRILKSLHDQLAYLEIITNGHAGNWPTIGCGGILACLAAFPLFRDRKRLIDSCIRTMSEQIADRVLPDGVRDELTPHYHRLVVDNILSAIRSLRQLGRELDSRTRSALGKMVRYVQQTTTPNGSNQVAFNDSDPGRPGRIAEQLGEMGLAWLLVPPEAVGPEVFPYAGVAFLRQRSDRGDLYLAFDAGPYGRGHQHEDKLGFWLFAYGRSLLVDPGRHLYDGSAGSYYGYLKSTTAHSTIKIDGRNQHSAGRRDTWIARQPLDLSWQMTSSEIRAAGMYDPGYGRENEIAVVHRREIVFVNQRFWIVLETVEGDGEHHIESRFRFAPGEIALTETGARTRHEDANVFLVCVPTVSFANTHIEERQETPRGGWYSHSYGRIEPTPALSFSLRPQLPWRSATLLFPFRGPVSAEPVFTFNGQEACIDHPETGFVRVALPPTG